MAEEKKPTIFYNHNFLYQFEGVLQADDRAVQFGDGVYEWIRIHKGHPFALSYHIDRLYRSMRLMDIRATIAPDEFTEIHEVIAEENHIQEGYCMLLVTRGGGDHRFLIPKRNEQRPNVLIYARTVDTEAIQKAQDGIACVTAEDDRWLHCDILSVQMVSNLMTRTAALKKGAEEAIYLRGDQATEGTKSNLFIVKGGVVWTPPESHKMLKGVTRQLVIARVAPTSSVTIIEKEIDRKLLSEADEVFMTNSECGIIPVLKIDGQPVGDGKKGKVTAAIQLHYNKLLEEGLP